MKMRFHIFTCFCLLSSFFFGCKRPCPESFDVCMFFEPPTEAEFTLILPDDANWTVENLTLWEGFLDDEEKGLIFNGILPPGESSFMLPFAHYAAEVLYSNTQGEQLLLRRGVRLRVITFDCDFDCFGTAGDRLDLRP
jgi:hypothetical protein